MEWDENSGNQAELGLLLVKVTCGVLLNIHPRCLLVRGILSS